MTIRTHQIVHIKYVQFTVCQSYGNKTVSSYFLKDGKKKSIPSIQTEVIKGKVRIVTTVV